MNKILLLLWIFAFTEVTMGGVLSLYHVGRVTVRVVDEQGNPVSNATAGIGFTKDIPAGEGWGTRANSVRGKTDTNGMFSAEAKCNPAGSCSARKMGYYTTMGINFRFTNVVFDHWQPWNPKLDIVLRKIDNPVPMYAKSIQIESEIPIADTPVCYDLMIGDWVAPYGKGTVADFVFLMKRRVADWKDFETHLALLFSNHFDGIQSIQDAGPAGSAFSLPRTAPVTSYQTNWSNSIGYIPGKGYFETQPDNHPGYFFRTRSAIDEKGNMKCALYGKIKGPIRFDARDSKTAHIAFTYYLNPAPNDRNLEFDPERNLIKSLKPEERVTAP